MARLELDLSSVRNALVRTSPYLVGAHIEAGRLVVTVRKIFSARVRVWCEMNVPSRLLTLNLDADWILKPLLALAAGAIRQRAPFVVELSSSRCVLDLGQLQFDGRPITDWIEIERLLVPASGGAAVVCEFRVKE